MLQIGTPAPAFSLKSHDGGQVSLDDYAGKWLIMWWYPRACSEVCSIQGRAITPMVPEIRALGAEIIGVSFDEADANVRFAEQEGLDFPLLSDLGMEVGESYEVRRAPDEPFSDAPRRITYIIGPEGTIRQAYVVDDAAAHAGVIIADLKQLMTETHVS